MNSPWSTTEGDGPVVAFAIHAGHDLRPEVASRMILPEADRLREEDPFTDRFAAISPTHVVAHRSRFEVDLNRPRATAVYRTPADCWGLEVWREELAESVAQASLDQYDAFRDHAAQLLDRVIARHGRALVLDLHSYNHRREGATGPVADPAGNPEVNLGTGHVDRARWGHVLDRFLAEFARQDLGDGPADVRENVKFRGGDLGRWVQERHPDRACTLSIEFKKTFMDEWSGVADASRVEGIREALVAVLPALERELLA